MINVGRIVNGRNSQPFIVYRKSGSWVSGRWVQTEDIVKLNGTISIAKERDMQQIPEGERIGGEIAIYSTRAIYVTHAASDPMTSSNPGTSDEVEWHGERYRLFSVSPYVDYGYYKAIGIRMASN